MRPMLAVSRFARVRPERGEVSRRRRRLTCHEADLNHDGRPRIPRRSWFGHRWVRVTQLPVATIVVIVARY